MLRHVQSRASRGFAVFAIIISSLFIAPVPAQAAEHGAWNVKCTYSKFAPDDPIVYPGQPGVSHQHTFYGNTSTNAFTTEQSLLTAGPSTCERGFSDADHSAYWIPALFKNEQEVHTDPKDMTMTIYYRRAGGAAAPKVSPFPQGLRMISGDSSAKQAASHSSYRCINNKSGGIQTKFSHSFPTCDSTEGLLESVVFPDCWDGKNLDSPDHRSHMSFSTGSLHACPADHPVKVPQVTFEAVYHTMNGAASQYSLSSGGAFTLHGDFFAAWNNDVQKALVAECVNVDRSCTGKKLADLKLNLTPGNGQVLGSATTATPAPIAPAKASLPDTGAEAIFSSAIGLGAIGSMYYVYRRSRHTLRDELKRRPK